MKKLLSILTCFGVLTSFTAAFAQEKATFLGYDALMEETAEAVETTPVKNNEPTPAQMEAMIKKVRPKIDVPEEFEEFLWNFTAGSYYSLPSWSFTWTDNQTGEISVKCDNDGNITNYRFYDYLSDYSASLPQKTPKDFEQTAIDFIAKTAPYTKNTTLKLDKVQPASLYSNLYTYFFLRYENNVIVPDNSISVAINHKTGKVERFSASFTHKIAFDLPENIISVEKAKDILKENQNMILSYRLKNEYNDKGELESRRAYLVYTPEKSYISVDAVTGEVYLERNTWSVAEKNMSAGGSSNDKVMGNLTFDAAEQESAREDGYVLTEKELEQLTVLENLITKEEAIKVVTSNSDLYIDKDATAVSASLDKNYKQPVPLSAGLDEQENDFYVWNISFSAPYNEEKYHTSGMRASVNAHTGELISFSADTPDFYYYTENELDIPELKYTALEAKDIADKFIKKMQPEKYENIRYSDNYAFSPIRYIDLEGGSRVPVYGNYSFNFVRQNEGVDFTYNSFNVACDLITGKITNYNYNWYDYVDFESPKDAIGEKEALMSLYSYDGFGLNYEINSDYTYNKYLADSTDGKYIDYDELYTTNTYSRAVYSLYNAGTTIIRALDGKMIDYSGEEYKEFTGYNYSDIDSHWAEDIIVSFANANIGFDGDKFLPDEKITKEELTNIYTQCRFYTVDEIFSEGDFVTRMDAVKHIISALGYSKIASLENVFITDFADNLELLPGDVGFLAIARGLGFAHGDGETFRPYDTLTRAEALALAYKVINLGLLNR